MAPHTLSRLPSRHNETRPDEDTLDEIIVRIYHIISLAQISNKLKQEIRNRLEENPTYNALSQSLNFRMEKATEEERR